MYRHVSVRHGGAYETSFGMVSCKQRVQPPSPSTDVKYKRFGFYSGRPKDPYCSEVERVKTQPHYNSEYHLNVFISNRLKVSCIESLKNLKYEIDVNSDKF